MYEQFYGLSRTPFAVTPDPLMLFMSRIHREALATIIYGVETRKGFIVCTGEVGTGKSTIIRAFFDQAGADSVKLIYIFTPQVTPFEMARFICRELDLEDPESIFAAVPRLQLKLLEVFESGKTVVLMIDEAQLLPPETLEFLRLLSNFETDTEKLIQIVLVGQPEVDTMLARRDMRQVAQRIALRARLGAFSIEESVDYIDHRLRVSGAEDLAQVMSPSAAWLIAEAAGGIPRRINILADNALIAGFGAAQRPLGSRLAGIAVQGFLAKSGGASPPAEGEHLVPGWRAARRLRSALIREKEEAGEWAPTAMPPVAAPAVAPAAAAPTAARTGRTTIIHPVATPPTPPPEAPDVASVPPADEPTSALAATTPAGEIAAPIEVAAADEIVAPIDELAPLAAEIAAPIEAPAAPTAPQWISFTDEVKEWIGYEPTPAPAPILVEPVAASPSVSTPPLPAVAVAPVAATPRLTVPAPRQLVRVNGGAPPPRPTMRPAPPPFNYPSPSVSWPALARVRSGLQTPPRREPLR